MKSIIHKIIHLSSFLRIKKLTNAFLRSIAGMQWLLTSSVKLMVGGGGGAKDKELIGTNSAE